VFKSERPKVPLSEQEEYLKDIFMAKRTGKSKLQRRRMRFLEATIAALNAELKQLKEKKDVEIKI
jgi:hypothetical protein